MYKPLLVLFNIPVAVLLEISPSAEAENPVESYEPASLYFVPGV